MNFLFLTLLFCLNIPSYLLSTEQMWAGSAPGGFTSQIVISSSSLTLDDQLVVTVTLTHPKTYTVDMTSLDSNLLNEFEPLRDSFLLVSRKVSILEENEEKITQQITYTFDPLIPGDFSITFLDIDFLPKSSQQKPVEIFSDVFEIHVSPLESPPNFPSFAPPLSLSIQNHPPLRMSAENRAALLSPLGEVERNRQIFQERTFPFSWALGFSLLGFVLFLAWIFFPLFWRRIQAKPTLTPQENALLTLEQLQRRTSSTPEEFYDQLTNTLRSYIEENYHVLALHSSTEEFLKQAASHDLLNEQTRSLLAEFLKRADLVKFADYEPTEEDCAQALASAREFIARR